MPAVVHQCADLSERISADHEIADTQCAFLYEESHDGTHSGTHGRLYHRAHARKRRIGLKFQEAIEIGEVLDQFLNALPGCRRSRETWDYALKRLYG